MLDFGGRWLALNLDGMLLANSGGAAEVSVNRTLQAVPNAVPPLDWLGVLTQLNR
jgi:hypothetical protein